MSAETSNETGKKLRRSVVAEHLRITITQLTEYKSSGIFPESCATLDDFRTAFIAHLIKQNKTYRAAHARESARGSEGAVNSREALNAVRLEDAKLDLARKKNEVVSVAEVRALYFDTLSIFRQNLESLPTKLAAKVLSNATPAAAEKMIRAELHAVMHAMARRMGEEPDDP